MKRFFAQTLILVAVLFVFTGTVMADEQTVNVNVNVNQQTVTAPEQHTVFSLGITSPIFGNATNKGGVTTKLTGINWCLGYTVRNYLGQGLPYNGGAMYFDYGTVLILVPYLGIGYTYRVDGNLMINFGIPEGVSFGFKL